MGLSYNANFTFNNRVWICPTRPSGATDHGFYWKGPDGVEVHETFPNGSTAIRVDFGRPGMHIIRETYTVSGVTTTANSVVWIPVLSTFAVEDNAGFLFTCTTKDYLGHGGASGDIGYTGGPANSTSYSALSTRVTSGFGDVRTEAQGVWLGGGICKQTGGIYYIERAARNGGGNGQTNGGVIRVKRLNLTNASLLGLWFGGLTFGSSAITETATMWSDPTIIWQGEGQDNHGGAGSIALFMTAISTTTTAITWALKWKPAPSLLGPWPADNDASIVTIATGSSTATPEPPREIFFKRNGEIIVTMRTATINGYRSKTGGKSWTSWV